MSKFHLLTNLALTHLNDCKSARASSLVYEHREVNKLLRSITILLSKLLNFGFLSSLEMFKTLLPLLKDILEGRNDILKMVIPTTSTMRMGEKQPVFFTPPRSRFKMSSYSPLITMIKVSFIHHFQIKKK